MGLRKVSRMQLDVIAKHLNDTDDLIYFSYKIRHSSNQFRGIISCNGIEYCWGGATNDNTYDFHLPRSLDYVKYFTKIGLYL